MSLHELAAATLFPSFPGTDPPPWIRRFLAEGGGGIVLFAYNVRDREQPSAGTCCSRSTRRAAT
jgi:beta-N-acetylhexosaminidase